MAQKTLKKLIKRSEFNASNFKEVSESAKVEIERAKENELLVLTIVNNSPTLSVTKAEKFSKDVFAEILKS